MILQRIMVRRGDATARVIHQMLAREMERTTDRNFFGAASILLMQYATANDVADDATPAVALRFIEGRDSIKQELMLLAVPTGPPHVRRAVVPAVRTLLLRETRFERQLMFAGELRKLGPEGTSALDEMIARDQLDPRVVAWINFGRRSR